MTDHRAVSSAEGRNGDGTHAERRAVELADAERALRAEAKKALRRVRDELAATRDELETTRAEALRLREQLDGEPPEGEDQNGDRPVADDPAPAPPIVEPVAAPEPLTHSDVRTVARADMGLAERLRTRAALGALPAVLGAGEWLHGLAVGRRGNSRCLVAASDRGLHALSRTGREHELIQYEAIESAEIFRVRRSRLALHVRSARGDVVVNGRLDRLQRMQFDLRGHIWQARGAR